MKFFIELPILHHNDTTSTFKNIGVDYNLSLCEVRNVIFYHINAISPYIDEDNNIDIVNYMRSFWNYPKNSVGFLNEQDEQPSMLYPTHWQPLPNPPINKQKRSKPN